MFLGRPTGGDLVRLQVNDRHGRLRPKTDVEAVSLFVEPASVWERRFIRYFFQRRLRTLDRSGGVFVRGGRWCCRSHQAIRRAQCYVGHLGGILQVHSRNALAPDIRDEEASGVAAQRHSRRDAALLHVAQFEDLRIEQVAVLERKRVDHLITCAAAKQPRAIAREFDPVKCLIDRKFTHHFARRHIDHRDLVASVTGVQDCDKAAAWMDRDVDGEVAERDLSAHWPQGPLIRQQDGAIGALAGQISGSRARALWRLADARGESQESGDGRQYLEEFHKQECASYASIRCARKDAT